MRNCIVLKWNSGCFILSCTTGRQESLLLALSRSGTGLAVGCSHCIAKSCAFWRVSAWLMHSVAGRLTNRLPSLHKRTRSSDVRGSSCNTKLISRTSVCTNCIVSAPNYQQTCMPSLESLPCLGSIGCSKTSRRSSPAVSSHQTCGSQKSARATPHHLLIGEIHWQFKQQALSSETDL